MCDSEYNIEFTTNLSGPDVRDYYLKRAKDAFDNGQIEDSIVHQTKALGLGFNAIYGHNARENDIPTSLPSISCLEECIKDMKPKNPLIASSLKFLNTVKVPSNSDYEFYRMSSQAGLQYIMDTCKRFPDEWTVVQICKDHFKESSISTFRDIQSNGQPIYLTLLKHPRFKKYPQAVCIKVSTERQNELFEKFAAVSEKFKKYSNFTGNKQADDKQEKIAYWHGMDVLNKYLEDVLAELERFIGPWYCLFSGIASTRQGKAVDNAVFRAVDKFCDKNGLSTTQRIILSMVSREAKNMNKHRIRDAVEYIADGHSNLLGVIHDFLTTLNVDTSEVKRTTCMLIVDERLDHMFWEFLNPRQEFSRVNSFFTLLKLFEKYKARIKNGYLQWDVQNGSCVVNPDNNLPKMEERMMSFFAHWLPHFKCVSKKMPSEDALREIFRNSHCYVYCGHGSGMQLINGHKISKMQVNCVVFLFGCDSLRFSSNGLYSEMIASHLYYHASLCPALVGTLVVGLDFQMDKASSRILSTWITSKQRSWSEIDFKAWRHGGQIKYVNCEDTTSRSKENKQEKSSAPAVANIRVDSRIKYANSEDTTSKPNENKQGKSLATVVAIVRFDNSEELYNRIGFVYRGLPVWNCS